MDIMFQASLLAPVYTAFGWLMRQLYFILGNYGLSIIFFTILVRLFFIPFNVKQHKSSLQQQALQPQLNELQRFYKGDKEKYSQAQMSLYKEHGVSMMGGCLPLLLTMVLMWPVYRVVSGPLNYIVGVPVDNLRQIADIFVERGILAEAAVRDVQNFNIALNQALFENPGILVETIKEGLIRAQDLLNMNFLGLNTGLTPSIDLGRLMGPERSTYLPLLIIPILTAVTSFLPTLVGEKLNPAMQAQKKQKELAKINPAQQTPQGNQDMMGCMKWSMPLMMVFFSFSMPAAMGLYWIVGNLMAVVQSMILYYLYTKPFYQAMEAADSKRVKTREEAAGELKLEEKIEAAAADKPKKTKSRGKSSRKSTGKNRG